jgi:hypothetical protein
VKRVLAKGLQFAVLVAGAGALVFLLWEPLLEGRNAHSTVFQVYFNDPFLAFVYLGSTAFFAGAFQVSKLLGHFASHGSFPPTASASLRLIRRCALVIIGFAVIGEVIIFLNESDDRAGGVFMGGMIGLGAMAVALAASRLENRQA